MNKDYVTSKLKINDSQLGSLLGVSKQAVSLWGDNDIPKRSLFVLKLLHPELFKTKRNSIKSAN